MKKTTNVLKIVSCILISIYTLLARKFIFDTAWIMCQRFVQQDGKLVLAFDSVTPASIPYFIFSVIVILLGVATVLSLFRRAWIWSIIAGIEALALALTGSALNTDLAEVSTLINIFPSASQTALLRIMPAAAVLCVCSAVAYAVLCVITAQKQQSGATKKPN